MDKKEIRQQTLARLERLSQDVALKKRQADGLYQQLFASQLWQEASAIGVTLSTPFELDTWPIIQAAWAAGKQVAVPKVVSREEMLFYQLEPTTKLEESAFGIKEPVNSAILEKTQLQLVLVPGVAFQREGQRVGYGGGFYDRYLADYTGQTCSLVLAEQLGFTWQPDLYDIPVQTIFHN